MQLTDKVTINGETLTIQQWLVRGAYAYANLGWEGTAIDQRLDALARTDAALKSALEASEAGEPERVKEILKDAIVEVTVLSRPADAPPA